MAEKLESGIVCICRACENKFTLTADSEEIKGESTHIRIASCESGGVYDARIRCPHCSYEHDLM